MILDELTLHHFGVYGPRQVVPLTPPSPDRPIVLFGGLNGGGKTTLLDAIQLCLFGPHARCSNRGGLGYHDYLLRSIHRRASVAEAAIELAFRHTTDGVEERFRLHRSWRRTAGGCRKRFEVVRNGRLDQALTENWAQEVDDLFPARIAHLFLFDGEKVEAYAAPESSSALVGAAIHDLLGLDIVDHLDRDLQTLERRKRAENKEGDASSPAIEAGEQEVRTLRRRLDELKQQQAGVRVQIERKRLTLADTEDRFRKLGGELFEQREALEERRKEAGAAVEGVERSLRELAADCLPLLLVPDLLASIRAPR
jgi:DNA sulfur modification protein DndD